VTVGGRACAGVAMAPIISNPDKTVAQNLVIETPLFALRDIITRNDMHFTRHYP
jgi:hypothetical protein